MFGFDIFDASLLPSMVIAVAAGFLSFLSPCVLPIVPPYLAYISGISVGELQASGAAVRRRTVTAASFFVLGLSTVFLFLGFAASTFGRFFLSNQEWFTIAAGLVILVFGAHFIGVFRLGFLDRELRVDAGDRGGSAMGAYVLGLAFAFGWTPCIGPILGAILSIAASEGSIGKGMTLLTAYAVGLGVPFLLVAAFFPSLSGVMGWMRRNMARIEKVVGLLLWTVGLFLVTGQFTDFALWLNEKAPVLQSFG